MLSFATISPHLPLFGCVTILGLEILLPSTGGSFCTGVILINEGMVVWGGGSISDQSADVRLSSQCCLSSFTDSVNKSLYFVW